MRAFIVVGFMLFISSLILRPGEGEFTTFTNQGSYFANSMEYYHSHAETLCLSSQTQGQCPNSAGVIPLETRAGATAAMAYGKAFISFTDGTSYIATVSQPAGLAEWKSLLGWMVKDLNDDTSVSMSVGRWSEVRQGVIMQNVPSTSVVTPQFIPMPQGTAGASFTDGMPVLVTMRYS